eukprot:1930298-Prorocentrum_lima.AAC.1
MLWPKKPADVARGMHPSFHGCRGGDGDAHLATVTEAEADAAEEDEVPAPPPRQKRTAYLGLAQA